MEIKKDTVKEVRRWSDEPYGEYKLFTFTVTMTGGDEGRVSAKTKEHPYFVVGKEVEYCLEEVEKKDKSGSYVKISKPSAGYGGGGGSKWQPKGPKEYLSEFAGMCTRYSLDALIAQGKDINEENMKEMVHMMYRIVHPLIMKIHG
jgi:hypothetical protein